MMVSIIMPVYNGAAYIRASIDSVLNQTLDDWELLVADDASSDGTSDIVRSIEDSRVIHLWSEVNMGAGAARNRAVQQARGRFIAFLDADDIWLPEKLERQVQFMRDTGCGISCTDYVKIDKDNYVISPVITDLQVMDYRSMLRSNCIACSTSLVDTQQFPRPMMPNIKLNHDYALWLSLLREGGQAQRLKEPLVRYRVHKASLSKNKFESARYNWHIYRKLEGLSVFPALWYMLTFMTKGLRKYLK